MTSSSSTRQVLPIRLQGGVTVYVPTSLRITTTYVLLEQEAWFEDEVNFVRAYLRPGECAVDVGANFGVYTTAMAEAVGPHGKIFAFEPSAETAQYLMASVQLKHGAQVEVIEAAVSDHMGQAQFQVGSTPETSALATTVSSSAGTETVRLTTLDDHFCGPDSPRVNLIKVDAEGHELQVGLGARKVITRDEPLLLFEIKHLATFEFRFLEFLESLGWSGYRLAPGMNMLMPFTKNGAVDPNQLNLFGCSPRKAEELRGRGLLASPSTADLLSTAVQDTQPPPLFSFGKYPDAGTSYGLALAHFTSAQQAGLEANHRMGHMWHALRQAERAYTEKKSFARRVTFARIAADLGNRTAAAAVLEGTLSTLRNEHFAPPDEPCLPPANSYAPTENSVSTEQLCVATLETFERLRSFSSFFSGPKALPFIEYVCRQPRSSAEMHRRRQLLRIIMGLQTKQEFEPKLTQESAGNLNAWFWRG